MAKRQVFYSFSYADDVFRVQQIRNIGVLEGNPPVSPNQWEQIKQSGKEAVKRWIDENMKYKSCIVVLIGSHTASRPWVQYEIKKAWDEKKPVVGIYIHNLNCPRNGKSRKGANPFDFLYAQSGQKLSSMIEVHDPSVINTYSDIARNIEYWVSKAITIRSLYP